MKRLSKKRRDELEKQALVIATEIFSLLKQYTNDNIHSKFFLPEEINQSFYIAAGGFASVIYDPQLDLDEIQKTYVLLYFLILITYGFQIYLKERSLRTNAAPYRLPTNKHQIDAVRDLVFKKAEQEQLESSVLADNIIAIMLKQLSRNIPREKLVLSDHIVDEVKLQTYTTVALYFGYNFANQLLKDDTLIARN